METETDLNKIYFIVKIGTNERVMLPKEQQPLIINNIDDAITYAEKYTIKEQEKQTRFPYGFMAISVTDFMNNYGYS